MTSASVVIIGGGIHGCAAAVHLSRAGFSVIVIERQYSGRHASGVNAGGVRRLGRHPAEVPLSVAALERWQKLKDIIGDDGGFNPCGHVQIAETKEDVDVLEKRVELVNSLGFNHEVMLSSKDLRRLIPSINASCVGGLFCEGDGAANPWQTSRAWQAQAKRDGVKVLEKTKVIAIQAEGNDFELLVSSQENGRYSLSANILINCAGAWGGEISALLGDPNPVNPQALMMSVTERVAPFIGPVVGATSRSLSFKQAPNGSLIIGGGLQGEVDTARLQGVVNAKELSRNYRTVTDLFPSMLNVRVVRTWAGIEGVTPDEIPVLGRSHSHPNAIHSFGYCGHGFQLSAITGEIVRDLALGREPELPIEPFSIRRFMDCQ